MGKTVPSYRIVLEEEISGWRGFAKALRREDLLAFEGLMDMCRKNAMAAGNACNPVIFESMVMSMLLAQQKQIMALEKQLTENKHAQTRISLKVWFGGLSCG